MKNQPLRMTPVILLLCALFCGCGTGTTHAPVNAAVATSTEVTVPEITASLTAQPLAAAHNQFIPNQTGAYGTVIATSAPIYPEDRTNASPIGYLSYGDRIRVTALSHYGKATLACVGNGWIHLDALKLDSCDFAGAIPCTVTNSSLNHRAGPDSRYDVTGSCLRGDQVYIVQIFDSLRNGKPWARTTNGYWIYLPYLELPDSISVLPGTNASYSTPQ